MREYVALACEKCGARNYMTSKETKGTGKLSLKKYCRHDRAHTTHVEKKKK
jgi:large subunit ribosomal protein L33